jgi:hypothetical protein
VISYYHKRNSTSSINQTQKRAINENIKDEKLQTNRKTFLINQNGVINFKFLVTYEE